METSSRRKACDTCYSKKIKCDQVVPVCSNCQLYKVKCTTTVIRRRAMPPKQKTANPPPQSNATGQESLEARLARIESKLSSLDGPNSVSLAALLGTHHSATESASRSSPESNGSGPGMPTLGSFSTSIVEDLPPLQDTLPLVDAYFQGFNNLLPLFDQSSFMKLLRDFYAFPIRRSRTSWGVINCVLALGSKALAIEQGTARLSPSERPNCDFEANAQKCLDDFMTRDKDTLGIQGILALVILYQARPDSRSAFMRMGAAVGLVHRLQLHTRSSHASFSAEESRQRDNIFWMCYILEKYVSIRTKTTSLQRDDDLDVDLPAEDGDGLIVSEDGLVKFNFFRARIQLAHLQGKIFDTLYSVRSKRLSPEDRRKHVTQLDIMLEKWHQTIPVPFQLENMQRSLHRMNHSHMAILHHLHLMCLVFVHGLYSLESGWIQAIGAYGQAVLANMDNNTDICMRKMQPPMPSAWAKCVRASRGSIRLFLFEPQHTCSLWLNMGSYFSGIIVLLANCQYYPTDEQAREDHKLAKDGAKLLLQLVNTHQDDDVIQIMSVLENLESIAEKAINHYQGHPEFTPYPPVLAPESFWMSENQFIDGLINDLDNDTSASNPGSLSTWASSSRSVFEF
ncbi:fungal-specific transcription factor domain-containing protein [Truncatella angustata]|uniref:Fungal-specific transcription factor domain-containing protein n=1 Tax=Truncatella angustata TaxID=152316 RepID=A0A9P9A077_9PEZI|nr:fungal-specific transcription factor domain-containing protein [Truncatella angustata]KAH6655749.1 fungal-specific transcription factor domain-containing protein [Truncatella angustata]